MQRISEYRTVEPQTNHFARTPFRSSFFILGTVAMCFNLVLAAFILSRLWNHFPSTVILYIAAAAACMLRLWYYAFTTWKSLHGVYSRSEPNPSFADSPLDLSLRSAGVFMMGFLYFSSFMAMWLLFALLVSMRSGYQHLPS